MAVKEIENEPAEVPLAVTVPSPYKGECAYCEFGSSCNFDPDTDSAREVPDRILPSDIEKAVAEDTAAGKGGKDDNE